jgi:putative protease
MQLGTHQVSGVVNEEGTHFLCKYKTLPLDELEIVAPLNSKIEMVDNEIGTTYERDGRVYLKLKQLLAENKKVWDEVHSGNLNPITLPTKLPAYTFLRIPSTEDMENYPKS